MWTPETPAEEGWYWIKYKVGRALRKCPCLVIHLDDATLVKTAMNVVFIEGPHHGGKGLKVSGTTKVVKSIRFGPAILPPDED